MKATIGEAVGLNGGSDEIDLLERRIEAMNKRMLELVNASVLSGEDVESHEDEFKDIAEQTEQLKRRIQAIRESESNSEATEQRLQEMQEIIDSRNAYHDTYDDSIVRQMIECIKVGEEGKLRIIFGGGYEIEEHI